MIDRIELDQGLREHDYALITREQAAQTERIRNGPGVVPWDEHRRALAKADAEIAKLRSRVARLEAAGRELVDTVDRADYAEASRAAISSLDNRDNLSIHIHDRTSTLTTDERRVSGDVRPPNTTLRDGQGVVLDMGLTEHGSF